MPRVRLPAPLRPFAGGEADPRVEGETVGQALAELVRDRPALRRHLFAEDGALRGYVNVYLGDEDVRAARGLDTSCAPDDTITIVPSVAGGSAGAWPERTQATESMEDISVTQLKERLDSGDRPTLIDVREPYEWEICNLAEFGARLIPLGELGHRLDELDASQEIVFYCRSGARSGRVVDQLQRMGFPRARNLQGGMLAWSAEIDPSVPRY